MYSQIDKNKRATLLLLTTFTAVIVGFTYIISYAFGGNQYNSISLGIIAFVISLISGLFSYYSGAALVLAMTGAIDVTENPEYTDLNQRIEILSTKAGIPKPRVHILPDQALNAFATGRDPKHGHVAITRGLMEHMSPDELEAVIAHELGHIRNYDIRLMLIVSVLAGVLTYMADFFIRGIFYSRSDDDNRGGNVIGLIVAIVFAILAPIIATLVQLAISRRREFLADATAVEITRYPQSMIRALEKLQHDDRPVEKATSGNAHMFIDFPLKSAGGFLRKLFSTHPPIEDRIAALQKL